MPSESRVLIVSPGPDLTTPESGEGTRLKNLSRELANRDWEVIALVPRENSGTKPEWIAQQYAYRQWSLPYLTDLNPSFVRALRRVLSSEEIDIIHLSTGVCAAKLASLIGSDATIVYAAQNVEADHAQDFVDPELPAYKRFLGPRLIPLIERTAVHCADGLTTVSDKDRSRFIKRYGVNTEKIRTVPTGTTSIDESELDSPSDVREQLELGDGALAVFHGYFDHPPNREAAELIDERIAPTLIERDTDAEFLLVGKNPPNVSSPNVHAVGFVEDLFSVLNAADVAVAPVIHGGGTKTKLYDYVSLGLPIVATEKAVEGVDVEDGRHGVIVSDVDDTFTSGLSLVLSDDQLRKDFQDNLRQLSKEWSWSHSADRLVTAYRELS